jgi:hypothetical protein
MPELTFKYRLREFLCNNYIPGNLILTNSGRIALYLGLKQFFKKGDLIAVQAGVCRAVLWAIKKAEMRYVEIIGIDGWQGIDGFIYWKKDEKVLDKALKYPIPLILDMAKLDLTLAEKLCGKYVFGILSFGKGKSIGGCGGGALFSEKPLRIEINPSRKSIFVSVYYQNLSKPIIAQINKLYWLLWNRNHAPNFPVEEISEFDATVAFQNAVRDLKK